jgi:hypothetical protein
VVVLAVVVGLAVPFRFAFEGLAVVSAVMGTVLGMIPMCAGDAGAEAADRESGADGGKGNDPAYALQHGSPFAGRGRLAIGR